jgi:hypothetical protein
MKAATIPASVYKTLPILQSGKKLVLKAGDTIIHAPGFEDRTMSICQHITVESGVTAVLLDYRPLDKRNRLSEIRRNLSAAGIQIGDADCVIYDRFKPDDFETRLADRLKAQSTRRAIVDISSMSKLAIMLVMQTCQHLGLDLRVVYTEAEKYGPSEEEFERARRENKIHRPSLHVFNGIHGVVRVDSLASVAMQGQPTAAIVFMSFNDALTQLLLNTVYPGRLFLINGRPPMHSWREAATAWVHDQVRKEWDDDNPVGKSSPKGIPLPLRMASTLEYRESVSLLLSLYWQLSTNHRVLLAPSGSKMQTIACFLVKALHPDIHIEYPSPEGFAQEYSSGVGKRWLLDVGPFDKRLKLIADAERKSYLELPEL